MLAGPSGVKDWLAVADMRHAKGREKGSWVLQLWWLSWGYTLEPVDQ
jgi:hypothetical protein